MTNNYTTPYFDIMSIEPMQNILIEGDAKCGKTMLLKNIFPYIAGGHDAVKRQTIPKVLIVGSTFDDLFPYTKFSPSIQNNCSEYLIVNNNYSLVLKYAEAHKNHYASTLNGELATTKEGLLIIIDNICLKSPKNVTFLDMLYEYKKFGVSMVVITPTNFLDASRQLKVYKLFDFKFSEQVNAKSLDNTYTFFCDSQTASGGWAIRLSNFRPWCSHALFQITLEPALKPSTNEDKEKEVFEHISNRKYVTHLENMSMFTEDLRPMVFSGVILATIG